MAESYIRFTAPAVLKKYASLGSQRRTDIEFPAPYLLHEGTLDDCIKNFMAKPASQQNLYEIHTAPQPPLITPVLHAAHIAELARLRVYLGSSVFLPELLLLSPPQAEGISASSV